MAELASKDRSPSFPIVPLPIALQRLAAFEQTFGRHPAPADKVGLAWGMTEKSSKAYQVLAALKSFGLIAYQGSSRDRKASLTEEARTYLRAQQEKLKQEIVQKLARKPKTIENFWHIWGADRPPDAVCLDDLVLKHGFTETAAKTFLKVYDETIRFAQLSNDAPDELEFPDELEPMSGGNGELAQRPFEVGDLVQIEINGALQLPAPERIRAVQDHNGEQWVFLQNSQTGIPASQALLVGAATKIVPNLEPPVLPLEVPLSGWEEEQLIDDSGQEIRIRYKGKLTLERYEYIRDYLDFKIARLAKTKS